MKKLNRVLLAVATVVGLSATAAVAAQMNAAAQNMPAEHAQRGADDSMMGWCLGKGQGPHGEMRGPHHQMQGQHRGMRGEGRGHRGRMMRDSGMNNGHMGGRFSSYKPRDYMVSLVTPAEMAAYQNDIKTATSVEACQKVDAAQRKLVQERAAAMNVPAPEPSVEVCVELEKSGWYSR